MESPTDPTTASGAARNATDPPRARRASALFHVSLFSAARYLAEALYLVRGLVLARILGPEIFGVWSSMRVVRVFARLTPLGSVAGMTQLAPLAAGRSELESARGYQAAAAGLTLVGSVVFALIVCVLVGTGILGADHPLAWLLFVGFVVLAQGDNVVRAILRTQHRFERLSAVVLLIAALSTAGGLLGASRAGLEGFLVALCISTLVVAGGAAAIDGRIPRPTLDTGRLRELVATGYRIVLANSLAALQWNMDRILVWAVLGTRALGLYALVSYLVSSLRLLPFVVVSVLYPRLLERLGRRDSPREAWSVLERATPLLAQVACPLIGLAVVALPLPIHWFLAEYESAIEPGRVLLLASWLALVTSLPGMVLISLRAAGRLAWMRAAGVASTAIIGAAALFGGAGLTGAALATTAGFLLQAVLVFSAALGATELPAPRVRALLARTLLPYALLLVLVAIAMALEGERPPTHFAELVETAKRVGIVCVPTSVIALYSARQWLGRGRNAAA